MSVYDCPQAPRAVAADTPPPALPNLAPGDAAAGREFEHRGWFMAEDVEQDGDGGQTPAFIAWRPDGTATGARMLLHHPRFRFTPTLDWFRREVDRALDSAA